MISSPDLTSHRAHWRPADSAPSSPSIDVKESDKDFTIRAELPGVDEKDIEVTVTNDAVTIKGEKKEEKEDKGKNYYYMERSYGSFNRVIPLADGNGCEQSGSQF